VQGQVEQAGEALGMPTRTEVDAAHRKIVQLERELRRLRDQMAGMPSSSQGEERPAARKPATKATKAPVRKTAAKKQAAKKTATKKAPAAKKAPAKKSSSRASVSKPASKAQIGRASCRERGKMSVVNVTIK